MRYDRCVIESFVDLTYRGLSLGRRVKLSQVRPGSGLLELATPMPVGTAIALTTDDGLAIDATVTWVYEQVAGTDRPPGMLIAPVLADDAATWWQQRVVLPADEAPRARSRTRPVTLRPRTSTLQTPPGGTAATASSVAADLQARVAAAAGVAPPALVDSPASVSNAASPSDAGLVDVRAQAPVVNERPTVAMPALTQAQLQEMTRNPEAEPMRSTGEHSVIDDGQKTVMMEAIDPSALGLEPAAGEATIVGDDTLSDGDDGDDNEPGDTEPPANVGGDAPATSKGGRKRRRRR